MKITELFLTETIDNLFTDDTEKRKKYVDQVWDILNRSYAPIGGIKGSGFRSPEDMIENIPMWKIFRRGDDVKIVMMYKDKGGRKRVALGTDGSDEAKSMLATMIRDEYLQGRAFGEVSGPSLRFIRKVLGDKFDDIVVPVSQVKSVLKKEWDDGEIRPTNDSEYERLIGGSWHPKIMLGTPGKTIK